MKREYTVWIIGVLVPGVNRWREYERMSGPGAQIAALRLVARTYGAHLRVFSGKQWAELKQRNEAQEN